jgi:hypothetical protein
MKYLSVTPKFIEPSKLSFEQLTDPDYAIKKLQQEFGMSLPIKCTMCHHCR